MICFVMVVSVLFMVLSLISTKIQNFEADCKRFKGKKNCCPVNFIISFFSENICAFRKKCLYLHHKNPPSLFTMLKSAGRFIL